jgi:hypothetical protein
MRRAGAALLVLALLSLIGAASTAVGPARLAWSGERIEGRAAGVLREPLGPVVRLRPIIAYRLDGAERRILGSGLVAHAAGVPIPVLHDRASGRAGLAGFAEAWLAPAALAILFLVLAAPGAWLWLRAPPPERRIGLSSTEQAARRTRGEPAMGKRQAVLRSRR